MTKEEEEKAAVVIQRWWRGFERCEYEPLEEPFKWGPKCGKVTNFRDTPYGFVARCTEHTCPCPEEDWEYCGACGCWGCANPLHEEDDLCSCSI